MSQLASAALVSSASLIASPNIASAGIDPNGLKKFQTEGDVSGAETRLRQLQEEKVRPEDTLNIPYEDLPSGVSYREYREGKGEAVVKPGSKVAVEMTIRCKSFATANEPGGLKYFNSKVDTDFNEVAWTVGSGESMPGLEEGMMGMHKNAVRRIEVPSTMVFAARKEGQLPLPKDTNKDGKRIFDRLFKTDATLLFEVLVTRIK
jgi:FKBP-type peptidyl-prolyl cis-trans isomerase